MSKKLSITFPTGGIIPGSVLGCADDIEVPALTAIDVPADYGQHLIDDRFAVLATAETKKKAAEVNKTVSDEAVSKAVTAALAKAKAESDAALVKAVAEALAKAAEIADAELNDAVDAAVTGTRALVEAEFAVVAAEAAVASNANDPAAKEAAEAELTKARATLAGLQV